MDRRVIYTDWMGARLYVTNWWCPGDFYWTTSRADASKFARDEAHDAAALINSELYAHAAIELI